ALVYPYDGWQRVRGNHWWVTRRWVDVVGFFCPTVFEHFYCDTVAERIAQMADRFISRSDILVEHMHGRYGKAPKDHVYASKRQRGPDGLKPHQRDEKRFEAMRPQMEEAARRVRAAIHEARLDYLRN